MDMQELFGYSGKKVLVSGAFSGMGRAAARLLSSWERKCMWSAGEMDGTMCWISR